MPETFLNSLSRYSLLFPVHLCPLPLHHLFDVSILQWASDPGFQKVRSSFWKVNSMSTKTGQMAVCQTFCNIFFFFWPFWAVNSRRTKACKNINRHRESSVCVLMCWKWGHLLNVASHCAAGSIKNLSGKINTNYSLNVGKFIWELYICNFLRWRVGFNSYTLS